MSSLDGRDFVELDPLLERLRDLSLRITLDELAIGLAKKINIAPVTIVNGESTC